MSTPLDRPDGSGMSRTKLMALIAFAVPMAQRYLESRGWEVDDQVIRDILITLGCLIAWFLRSGMRRPAVQSLQPLLDSYERAFHDRARLAQKVAELEALRGQAKEAAHG